MVAIKLTTSTDLYYMSFEYVCIYYLWHYYKAINYYNLVLKQPDALYMAVDSFSSHSMFTEHYAQVYIYNLYGSLTDSI